MKLSENLRVEAEPRSRFVLVLEEHRALQAELWDEDDDGVLPHEQNEAFFVQNALALEEELLGKRLHVLIDGKVKRESSHDVFLCRTCVWKATEALWAYCAILCL